MTLAPSALFPPGFYILGLPQQPSLSQLDSIFQSVTGKSGTLAGLAPAFQLAPVARRSRKQPPFFLTHAGFADPDLVRRIMEELKQAGEVDHKGRACIPCPAGTLKVSIAQCSVKPAQADRPTAAVQPLAICTVPRLPSELSGVKAVAFHASTQDLPHTCVCCRQNFSIGEALVRLSCLHVVHADCMVNWLSTPHARGRCPECNLPVAAA